MQFPTKQNQEILGKWLTLGLISGHLSTDISLLQVNKAAVL